LFGAVRGPGKRLNLVENAPALRYRDICRKKIWTTKKAANSLWSASRSFPQPLEDTEEPSANLRKRAPKKSRFGATYVYLARHL